MLIYLTFCPHLSCYSYSTSVTELTSLLQVPGVFDKILRVSNKAHHLVIIQILLSMHEFIN